MTTNEKLPILKTPSYTLRAVHKYNKKNADIINKKAREKYALLTDEQKRARMPKQNKDPNKITTYSILPEERKQLYRQHKREKYQSLTPEQKEAYKAKQRENYQKRKLLKKVEIDIPIDKLKIE